jgi:hypothetical protein
VNTDLLANDDVVEIKPDLALAEKKHQAFGQVRQIRNIIFPIILTMLR